MLLCRADNHQERAEQVFPGMTIEGVNVMKLRASFKILSVNSQPTSIARYKLASTVLRIVQPNEDVTPVDQSGGDLVVTGVPGLARQVKAVNQFLKAFTRPFWMKGERTSCGFVLHGGHGTGKSFILQRIADTKWGKVHWIKPTDKLSAIRDVFKQARAQQPGIIFIDNLAGLIAKDRSNRETVIETIGEELDSLSAQAFADNTLPRIVVIATCVDFMTDIPEELQHSSRFYDNVALPIPRTAERLEILKFLDPPLRADDKEQCLEDLAQRTHAYNPRDLANLMLAAKKTACHRLDETDLDPTSGEEHSISREDLERAFRTTRSTAMNDVNLKPPTIHWQDVGGQEDLKKTLSRMIKNTKVTLIPLHVAHLLTPIQNTNPNRGRVLRKPPKGLLLYGPPGCSKTLSAQAMATESGFNFFAVKAAELLNMYVGESERAVRTLFERARAASPSIIFFDEIDSIGGQRSGAGGGAASRSTGSVNMLTTLLTEMDGFEALNGVLVLAATNRPEAMDPALLRPGRFDKVLYVGPPDQPAREAVFRVHLRGLSVSTDVDISKLARLAEGYSGAEIEAVVTQAGQAVIDRCDEDESIPMEIALADLERALEETPRNITRQMIEGYEKWHKQFKKV